MARSQHPRRLGAILALLVLSSAVLLAGPVPAASAAGDDGRLLLVMDSSGSMKEPTPSGQTKIAAAKDALRRVVRSLPESQQVGLRVYGAKVFSRSDPGACKDTQLVAPLETGNRARLLQAIAGYRPYGETPIGVALQQAGKDLGDEGKRNIVLVSDGEPTCEPDPCPVARELARRGIDLRIDVVGLAVGSKARSELSCIARAGRGSYYDVDSAVGLANSLEKLSTRASRPYATTGEAVTGTATAQDAPTIGAGDWVDELGPDGSPTGTRTYRLQREIDGSTLHVSASMRSDPSVDDDGVRLELTTADDGSTCGGSGITAQRTGGELLSASTSAGALGVGGTSTADSPCVTGDLVATVERQNGTDVGPLELRVIEEPPVEDVDALPASRTPRSWAAPPSGRPTRTVGGASFVDAPLLRPGTYRDTIVPGEVLTYQVEVAWGQRLTAEVHYPTMSGKLADVVSRQSPTASVSVVSPARARSTLSSSALQGPSSQLALTDRGETLGAGTAAVAYRSRAEPEPVQGASLAGRYTVIVFLDRDDARTNYVVPFTLDIGVRGQERGAPSYTEPADDPESTSASPTPSDEPSATPAEDSGDGSSFLVVPVLGVLVVLGVAVAGVALRRRRG